MYCLDWIDDKTLVIHVDKRFVCENNYNPWQILSRRLGITNFDTIKDDFILNTDRNKFLNHGSGITSEDAINYANFPLSSFYRNVSIQNSHDATRQYLYQDTFKKFSLNFINDSNGLTTFTQVANDNTLKIHSCFFKNNFFVDAEIFELVKNLEMTGVSRNCRIYHKNEFVRYAEDSYERFKEDIITSSIMDAEKDMLIEMETPKLTKKEKLKILKINIISKYLKKRIDEKIVDDDNDNKETYYKLLYDVVNSYIGKPSVYVKENNKKVFIRNIKDKVNDLNVISEQDFNNIIDYDLFRSLTDLCVKYLNKRFNSNISRLRNKNFWEKLFK